MLGGGGTLSSALLFYFEGREDITFCRTHGTHEPIVPSPEWKLDTMRKTPTFHGAIDAKEAERTLKRNGNNCFLTRYSNDYKLSVVRRGTFLGTYKHFVIDISRDESVQKFSIKGEMASFSSISDLLNFYRNHPITPDIPSIGTGVECASALVPVEIT